MSKPSKPLGLRIVGVNALFGSRIKTSFGPHKALYFFDDDAGISVSVCKHV